MPEMVLLAWTLRVMLLGLVLSSALRIPPVSGLGALGSQVTLAPAAGVLLSQAAHAALLIPPTASASAAVLNLLISGS
jgi:hypothetical protein